VILAQTPALRGLATLFTTYPETMNGLIDGIGLVAGLLTTTAFIPQVLKIYRTKSGKDISARMYSILSTAWCSG